ncbi:RDD family protein [Pontibacter arcticus]|uniref:RDD family protein n=1 Tax=Pontibacter arcticus TaxID=2080288 RepID=A0A364RBF4_9BACT|nr:RDD family protein [Pontibacter arcticus]RAU81614.1 RDD family protein [Pontibacter arcticus]
MQTAINSSQATLKRSTLYGGVSARFVSFLVDTTLLMFCYTLFLYAASDNPDQLDSWKVIFAHEPLSLQEPLLMGKTLLLYLYFPVLHWLYYTICESSGKQATIGKYTLGLKVTDLRGKRISFAQANLRYFSKIISALPVFLGFLLLLSTRRKQSLHDYLARTIVVTN